MSMRITSGTSSRANVTAVRPSPASPTTAMPSASDRMVRRPVRHHLLVVGQHHPDARDRDAARTRPVSGSHGGYGEPTPGALAQGEEATGGVDPFRHPAQPEACGMRWEGPVDAALTVVLDRDVELVILYLEHGPHVPGIGVPHDVGQRLLDHAIGDERRRRGHHVTGRQAIVDVHAHPRPARRVQQVVEVGQTGQRSGVRLRPKSGDGGPERRHRLGGAGPGACQCGPGARAVDVEGGLRCGQLDRDAGQRVTDDVMHLAGHLRAFVGDPSARLRLGRRPVWTTSSRRVRAASPRASGTRGSRSCHPERPADRG